MSANDWTHRGDLKLLRRLYRDGFKQAAVDVLQYCRMEKKPIPAWAIDAVIVESSATWARPTKKWIAHTEQWHKELMCYRLVKQVGWKKGLDAAVRLLWAGIDYDRALDRATNCYKAMARKLA